MDNVIGLDAWKLLQRVSKALRDTESETARCREAFVDIRR